MHWPCSSSPIAGPSINFGFVLKPKSSPSTIVGSSGRQESGHGPRRIDSKMVMRRSIIHHTVDCCHLLVKVWKRGHISYVLLCHGQIWSWSGWVGRSDRVGRLRSLTVWQAELAVIFAVIMRPQQSAIPRICFRKVRGCWVDWVA